MKFKKLIKAESLSEQLKAQTQQMDSDYNAIKEKFVELQNLLNQVVSATRDVYYRSSGTDDEKLIEEAKKAFQLANDASWGGIHNLHQAIVDTIYK